MNRSSFLKSLFTIVAAPKILSEICVKSSSVAIANTTSELITDLNLLTQYYYKQLMDKYGDESYSLFIEQLAKTTK